MKMKFFVVALAMGFAFASCGDDEPEPTVNPGNNTEQNTPEPEPEPNPNPEFTVDLKLMSPSEYNHGTPDPEFPDFSSIKVIISNPTVKVAGGYYGMWSAEAWEPEELEDQEYVIEILTKYGAEFTAQRIDYINDKGLVNTFYGLDPETEYIYVGYWIAEDGQEYYTYEYYTTPKGEDVQVPADLLGNWICPEATDHWGEETVYDWTMTLATNAKGVLMNGFDIMFDNFLEEYSLASKAPVATWDDTFKTLTVESETSTGIQAGSPIIWVGLDGDDESDIIFDVDLANYTMSLAIDSYGAFLDDAEEPGFYSLYDAPLVFYKEGHVPSAPMKSAVAPQKDYTKSKFQKATAKSFKASKKSVVAKSNIAPLR